MEIFLSMDCCRLRLYVYYLVSFVIVVLVYFALAFEIKFRADCYLNGRLCGGSQ